MFMDYSFKKSHVALFVLLYLRICLMSLLCLDMILYIFSALYSSGMRSSEKLQKMQIFVIPEKRHVWNSLHDNGDQIKMQKKKR